MKRKTLTVKDVLSGDSTPLFSALAQLTAPLNGYVDLTLDFTGVERISEDFARELFTVWSKNNPHVTLTVVKACDAVERTIHQVLKIHS